MFFSEYIIKENQMDQWSSDVLGVSGPLLRMGDMSPFWFCIYLNGVWKSGGENRAVCEVHTLLLTPWKGAP
jgi:hypothetical protein